MPRRMDIWRSGILTQSVDSVLRADITPVRVHWLPEQPSGTFLADPFGWWAGNYLHVFAERYDYRNRHGSIDRLTFDQKGCLLESRPTLRCAWHLSYPIVFEGEGEIWMLPEAYRSGRLTLYRSDSALENWSPAMDILLDHVPVDATPLWHAGRWWMFYSPADSKTTRFSHLHVAWAEKLSGPWHPHARNPVRIDPTSSRPGGRAIVIAGKIMLPVQDCTTTYGKAVRPLWIDLLNEHDFGATCGPALGFPAGSQPYTDGMHTLSACGPWTLFDVKRIDRSGRGWWLDIKRLLGPSA